MNWYKQWADNVKQTIKFPLKIYGVGTCVQSPKVDITSNIRKIK